MKRDGLHKHSSKRVLAHRDLYLISNNTALCHIHINYIFEQLKSLLQAQFNYFLTLGVNNKNFQLTCELQRQLNFEQASLIMLFSLENNLKTCINIKYVYPSSFVAKGSNAACFQVLFETKMKVAIFLEILQE